MGHVMLESWGENISVEVVETLQLVNTRRLNLGRERSVCSTKNVLENNTSKNYDLV